MRTKKHSFCKAVSSLKELEIKLRLVFPGVIYSGKENIKLYTEIPESQGKYSWDIPFNGYFSFDSMYTLQVYFVGLLNFRSFPFRWLCSALVEVNSVMSAGCKMDQFYEKPVATICILDPC